MQEETSKKNKGLFSVKWPDVMDGTTVVRKGMTLHELKLDRYGEDKDWVLLSACFCERVEVATQWPSWPVRRLMRVRGNLVLFSAFRAIFRLAARSAADQISLAADHFNKVRRIDFLEDASPGSGVGVHPWCMRGRDRREPWQKQHRCGL